VYNYEKSEYNKKVKKLSFSLQGEKMRLDDSVIGHVAKLIQLAILTGTDIVDHMRMIRFAEDDNVLFLDEEYKSNADSNIQSMLDQIETLNPGEE